MQIAASATTDPCPTDLWICIWKHVQPALKHDWFTGHFFTKLNKGTGLFASIQPDSCWNQDGHKRQWNCFHFHGWWPRGWLLASLHWEFQSMNNWQVRTQPSGLSWQPLPQRWDELVVESVIGTNSSAQREQRKNTWHLHQTTFKFIQCDWTDTMRNKIQDFWVLSSDQPRARVQKQTFSPFNLSSHINNNAPGGGMTPVTSPAPKPQVTQIIWPGSPDQPRHVCPLSKNHEFTKGKRLPQKECTHKDRSLVRNWPTLKLLSEILPTTLGVFWVHVLVWIQCALLQTVPTVWE